MVSGDGEGSTSSGPTQNQGEESLTFLAQSQAEYRNSHGAGVVRIRLLLRVLMVKLGYTTVGPFRRRTAKSGPSQSSAHQYHHQHPCQHHYPSRHMMFPLQMGHYAPSLRRYRLLQPPICPRWHGPEGARLVRLRAPSWLQDGGTGALLSGIFEI